MANPTYAEGAGSTATAGEDGQKQAKQAKPADHLLLTKLSIPRARHQLVERVRLTQRLHEGAAHKLTLIAAPAGWGKTTLISAWHSTPPGSNVPLAWVSLDPDDNDPMRFWAYVCTALDQLQPGLTTSALAILRSPHQPSIEAVLASLLNSAMNLSLDAVLVLDDYHAIDAEAIHRAVAFLLDHLVARLHIVMATRDDPPLPLARLRAQQEMTEIRAADLRCTKEETTWFFNRVMGLQISSAEAHSLETRTEGWIAGLQLAALALRDHDDRAGFIAAFTGSNRFIMDYLAEEVLLRQPMEMQSFLLKTSILDRLCAPLCAAVLFPEMDPGDHDLAASMGSMLERLDRANVFIVALDDNRRWYRYHHLFVDMLRYRLHQTQPGMVPELHRRASAWFEREGWVTEAVDHTLAAKDMERAARLIDQFAVEALQRGETHTVFSWISSLPPPIRSRPGLRIIEATAYMLATKLEAAEACLRDAERAAKQDLPDEQARIMLGRIAVIRAGNAHLAGRYEQWLMFGEQALGLLPETEVPWRAGVMVDMAHAFLVTGDVTRVSEQRVERVVELTQSMATLGLAIRSTALLARMRMMQGRLRAAAALYEDAARLAAPSPGPEALAVSVTYHVGMGIVLHEWNHLDAAEQHLSESRRLIRSTITGDDDIGCLGFTALADVYQARGEHSRAIETLEEFELLARSRGYADLMLARAAAARARVDLARGNRAAALSWAQESGLSLDDEPDFVHEEEYLALARIHIVLARAGPGTEGILNDVLRLLDKLLRAARDGGRIRSIVEILILQALALNERAKERGALAALDEALSLSHPEGYVRAFLDEGAPMLALLGSVLVKGRPHHREPRFGPRLDYVRDLLTDIAPPGSRPRSATSIQPPVDPLSERELEVLELLATGLSNREIASQLFLTVGTIKWYLNGIYTKLGVTSRTQAVARARMLDLVSDQ